MPQAICIYDFKAAEDRELSVYKNEIVDIVGKSENWWTVRNKYKQSGLVPVNYLAAPITDDRIEVVARGKTKKAHTAKSENEVSIEADQQVAILDKQNNYWWFVGFCGKTGYIPIRIIQEFKVMYNLKFAL
ncbi:NADPH oxidase organizer 1-like [Paramuricea clavata]|uniref:NADPH oxidase organizer 1-like n=1 Tax=Paramuricea clavata TaxID=317549 RepID=A0A7D9HFH7_PARCT|nr:NADPH oxidase organizer 1-like [Paramuricea clavata]